ncbi:MAG: GntR family transcriptional regulator [Dorea sp.]
MKILDKLPYENARSYAIRVLMHNIISLELPPGSAVSENELSAALSLSRTPVREALIELSRIGLVEILPQRGSYISKIDYERVEESRFMRLVIENAILKLACEGISQKYIDALENSIKEQKKYTDPDHAFKFLELDNEFHRLIFESVNKMWTYKIINDQMIHFNRLRTLSLKSIKNQHTIKDHEDILYAIQRKDAEMAEMLMTRHLTRHQMEKSELLELYPDYFK